MGLGLWGLWIYGFREVRCMVEGLGIQHYWVYGCGALGLRLSDLGSRDVGFTV